MPGFPWLPGAPLLRRAQDLYSLEYMVILLPVTTSPASFPILSRTGASAARLGGYVGEEEGRQEEEPPGLLPLPTKNAALSLPLLELNTKQFIALTCYGKVRLFISFYT